MTDKKFTDEEIIKALECCISTTTSEACAECPFEKQDFCDKDQWALERYALDLINRQKAFIESQNELISKLALAGKNAITEAYKEFAERLKNMCKEIIVQEWNKKAAPISWSHAYADFIDDIDNLLKEMVGE